MRDVIDGAHFERRLNVGQRNAALVVGRSRTSLFAERILNVGGETVHVRGFILHRIVCAIPAPAFDQRGGTQPLLPHGIDIPDIVRDRQEVTQLHRTRCAAQADKREAVKECRTVGRAGGRAEARLQIEHGFQAAAQIFRALETEQAGAPLIAGRTCATGRCDAIGADMGAVIDT